MLVDIQLLDRKATRDEVFLTKMQRMGGLVEKFCPEMNNDYWSQIRKLNRSAAAAKKKVN